MMENERNFRADAEKYSMYGIKLAQESLWPVMVNLYNRHLQKDFKRDPDAPPNIAIQAIATLFGFVGAEAVAAFCHNELSKEDKQKIATDIMVKTGTVARTLVKLYVKQYYKPEDTFGPNILCACGRPSTHTLQKEGHSLPVCDECDISPKEKGSTND